MKSIDTSYACELINFAATERAQKMGFAESQLQGATAAFNMLHRNGIAYLADEVGMGKTYVALGAMSLFRFQNPGARILVIAPRENIQQKWIKEQKNFCRNNWIHIDNCVKTFGETPVRMPVACGSIAEFATSLRYKEHADIFLRATSFSIATSAPERRRKLKKELLRLLPWVNRRLLPTGNASEFRDMYARILNAMVPEIDLLVIDEAHNFRHGFGEKVSNRNRVLGMALGHPDVEQVGCKWYQPRVKNLLLLSATPFESDYADLYHQLDVFGKAGTVLSDPLSGDTFDVSALREGDESERRNVARQFLIRRTQYIKVAGKSLSKNQYRRDWREGGYDRHDDPIQISDPKQRLIVGLMQKKVSEVLGESRFQNSFQIGMLSSFESFMESLSRKSPNSANKEQVDQDPVFDGEQEATTEEKHGADTHSLSQVIRSYQERFKEKLPHPKLDATAKSLADVFDTGEKALVFVRRVATVRELKSKLAEFYDHWLKSKMLERLPFLREKIDALFDLYNHEKLSGAANEILVDQDETYQEEIMFGVDDDTGSVETFFSWFFRGSGPKDVLSGAAFQKNRLSSYSSAYAAMFEDNHVALVLDRPLDPYGSLCQKIELSEDQLEIVLRNSAYKYFRKRSQQKTGYPRFYVLESYQYAALRLLADLDDEVGEKAKIVLHAQYRHGALESADVPQGFPTSKASINVRTFFTELIGRSQLKEAIWPASKSILFREAFHEQEIRRILIGTAVRLGASYVDLYLEAIRMLGSLELRTEATVKEPERTLTKEFLDLLEQQLNSANAFNAIYELSEIATSFDVLMDVNFPEARELPLSELSTLFARTLQHQDPVGGMSGGVNKRMVKQFRMPGYPLVLATTDVLQEGEDLHTYCRKVIHYGVTWTPSAMEQRTGRVDRIHSLAQRSLDGRDIPANQEELIQVHFPHLCDTVERLQVRTVLERLNRFLQLIHRDVKFPQPAESRIQLDSDILRDVGMPPRIHEKLESDFPVDPKWMSGDLPNPSTAGHENATKLFEKFTQICGQIADQFRCQEQPVASEFQFNSRVAIWDDEIISWSKKDRFRNYRIQPFSVRLTGQLGRHGSLIRFSSPVGVIKDDAQSIDHLYDLQKELLSDCRLCLRSEKGGYLVTVEKDRIFDLENTQFEEIADAFRKVVLKADQIEMDLLGVDQQEFSGV